MTLSTVYNPVPFLPLLTGLSDLEGIFKINWFKYPPFFHFLDILLSKTLIFAQYYILLFCIVLKCSGVYFALSGS